MLIFTIFKLNFNLTKIVTRKNSYIFNYLLCILHEYKKYNNCALISLAKINHVYQQVTNSAFQGRWCY